MRLYNSRTRAVEPFQPIGEVVTLYVCGITPYDTTHLGHAFTYVTFDTLVRFLEASGQPVKYVQNVTDIDDDILRKSKELGIDWRELGERETAAFLRDMRALNVRMPDHYVYATEEIPMMLAMTEGILAKQRAYERNGSVYYDVSSDPDFGKLSRLDRDEMLVTANERGNDPNDPNKSDPLDFVLWQAARPGEPTWESPWGAGRPGWHIECSAMSVKYLGPQLDIHGGGADLLFPHHEAEIAQSETYTGREPFVNVWMHTAMVRMDGEKMSKSLGNMVFIKDLLKTYTPDAIRLYLLNHHYRQPWEWDRAEMDTAQETADRLTEASQIGNPHAGAVVAYMGDEEERHFYTAMENDLDTPRAIAALAALAAKIMAARAEGQDVAPAQQRLGRMGRILGLTFEPRART
ncbi:MAG: cysteine--tRNA ligase [Ardenticatenaceae bacterium]|nr:cysteine--tRNA ligase [Ardenticatenaceae bacterium]